MLKHTFDPHRPYRVVIYLRMSDPKQNKRSPDQQLAEIKKLLKKLGYRWVIIKIYRDDYKSGRLFRKRPQFQQMLHDIKSGLVVADLILVDTIERFGRLEELPIIRKNLFETYGVLVLCADTNFADPTTPQGKAMGVFEAFRATEDERIKAHNVLRGKRDLAQRGFWPGGPRPFGYLLKSITKEQNGKIEIEGSVLEPHIEEGPIITLAFQATYEHSFGENRLAEFLNNHPDVPAKFKKFLPTTVGAWMKNCIYKGVLDYGEHCQDIVDDARVIQKNDEDDVLIVPDFCLPLTPSEIWDAVNRVRRARGACIAAARKNDGDDDKLIAPPAPGLCLKYLLTGLVRCSHCGRAMKASASSVYVTKDGESRRYTNYVCPGHVARVCPNSCSVPEEWLRQEVLRRLQERLFGNQGGAAG